MNFSSLFVVMNVLNDLQAVQDGVDTLKHVILDSDSYLWSDMSQDTYHLIRERVIGELGAIVVSEMGKTVSKSLVLYHLTDGMFDDRAREGILGDCNW